MVFEKKNIYVIGSTGLRENNESINQLVSYYSRRHFRLGICQLKVFRRRDRRVQLKPIRSNLTE